MASFTIRNLDARTQARLRARATHRQHSMEEEALDILRTALAENEHDLRHQSHESVGRLRKSA